MKKADMEDVANAEDESKTFDMYHVWKRWDIILLSLFLLALLIFLLYAIMAGTSGA